MLSTLDPEAQGLHSSTLASFQHLPVPQDHPAPLHLPFWPRLHLPCPFIHVTYNPTDDPAGHPLELAPPQANLLFIVLSSRNEFFPSASACEVPPPTPGLRPFPYAPREMPAPSDTHASAEGEALTACHVGSLLCVPVRLGLYLWALILCQLE